MKFWIKMFSGLFIGILVGAYLEPTSLFFEPLRITGSLFFRLLSLAVFPLLLFSAIRSIHFLRTQKRLFVTLVKSLGYYVLLSGIGATIGIVLGDVLLPGVGMNIQEFESPMKIFYPATSEFILNTVPESITEFLASGYGVISILFVAFLTAVGIILSREEGEQFYGLIQSIEVTLHKLNLIVLEFLPIGIFAYVGYTMGYMTADRIMPFLKLILIIIAGSFIQIFIIQALLVFAMTRMNPFKFVHAVMPAALTGFISGNRYTAYPVLVETVEHNLGADREVFTFAAGLGSAFSFSGSALAAGVTTMFVTQVYGLDLSVYLQIIIVLLITASTLKLDRIRDGSLVILSVILTYIIKLPAEGYALVLGITAVIYQIESTVNITGTAAVSCIVANSEGALSKVKLKDFI
jgi:Na+/H+-dicarboxylate symporter